MAISKVIYKTSAQDTGTVWMDATPATAAAADITAPKTAMLANGVLTTGTGSGGGSVTVEEKDVNFIDYDGSIVASYTASDFASLSALPANPSHSGLTAQGWNWSLSDAKTYVASYGKLWIGQMYVTDDGKTRIYIHLDNPDFLSPYLAIAVNGTVVVDWGDGSGTDTMTGTSNTTLKYQGHVYAATGDYTITLNPTSGKFTFYCSSQTYVSVLRSVGAQDTRATSRAYSGSITKIHIGNNADIGNDAFNFLVNCKSVTIPGAVTSFGSYAFYYCNSLKSITIPNNISSLSTYCFQYCNTLALVSISRSVTAIENYAFNYCRSLKTIIIPNNTTTIGNSAFRYCEVLHGIKIPNSVTSFGTYVFYYDYVLTAVKLSSGITSISDGLLQSCNSLKTIEIPSGVTSIGANAFNGCNDALEYHLLPTTPPTLSNTNAFTGIQSGTIIYVPYSVDHSILNDYKSASNWSTYASYMQEEPQ